MWYLHSTCNLTVLTAFQELRENYGDFRKTRGDGNCFFRAFGFCYLEKLLEDGAECKKFKLRAKQCKDDLISLGYSPFTVGDFHDYVRICFDICMFMFLTSLKIFCWWKLFTWKIWWNVEFRFTLDAAVSTWTNLCLTCADAWEVCRSWPF
jgi:hypothetical protein